MDEIRIDANKPTRSSNTALLVVRTRRSVSTRFVCMKYFRLRRGVFVQELKLIGEFGLKSKREVWRVKYTLAKISVSTTSWRGVCRLRLVNRFLETLLASLLF